MHRERLRREVNVFLHGVEMGSRFAAEIPPSNDSSAVTIAFLRLFVATVIG